MIPGGWELVAILAVLVLLFGASKLPSSARAIGQSMRIFKAETKGMQSSDDDKDQTGRAQTQQQDPPQALPASEQQAPQTSAQQHTRHTQQTNSETR